MSLSINIKNKMLKTFETYLESYNYGKSGNVKEAVIYSIVDGGKRIRPVLLLSLLKDYGVDIKEGFAPALAIEMIHTYSLCHDDLPAMDNDDYRRGKLSTHKKYGEDIAILAGDSLLTSAFEVISNDEYLSSDKKVKLISNLALFSGASGMIYGQQLDLEGENKTLNLEEITEINVYKTSFLITYSLIAASILAESEQDSEALINLGKNLGLAFQIQDDIFDVTKSFEELGKKASDEDNNKSTYVKLIGLEKSQEVLDDLFTSCFDIIETLDLKSDNLYNLVKKIQLRNN